MWRITIWLPLAPKCLCQKDFLLLPDPMFPCQDIREEQVDEDCSLCPGSTVLGGEVQSAYAGSTMPLGKVHPWIEGDNRAVHLLLGWHCLGKVWAPLEGFFKDQDQNNHSWAVPICLHWCPNRRGCCGGRWLPIREPLEEPDCTQSATSRVDKGQSFPKSVPQLEESAAPLLAGYHCWTSLSGPQQVKVEDTTTGVLGKGELNAKGQKSTCKVNQAEWDSTSPAGSPEPTPEIALPPGFKQVMACLQRDPLHFWLPPRHPWSPCNQEQ